MSKVAIEPRPTARAGTNIPRRRVTFVTLGMLALTWIQALMALPLSAQPAEDIAEIKVAELSDPPDAIAELIKQGDVRLITGGGPQGSPSTLPKDGRVAGETRFLYRYRYRSRASWTMQRASSAGSASPETMVNIKVSFRSLKLLISHDVWFRKPPPADRFWEDRVVKHEFDHVRLSSDPRIESQFLTQAKELRSIRVALTEIADKDGRVSNKRVQELIEERMKQVVETIADYVRIRYRELDRLTQHGLHPLPEDALSADALPNTTAVKGPAEKDCQE